LPGIRSPKVVCKPIRRSNEKREVKEPKKLPEIKIMKAEKPPITR